MASGCCRKLSLGPRGHRWALFREEVLRHAGGEQALRFGSPADLPLEALSQHVLTALKVILPPSL